MIEFEPLRSDGLPMSIKQKIDYKKRDKKADSKTATRDPLTKNSKEDKIETKVVNQWADVYEGAATGVTNLLQK